MTTADPGAPGGIDSGLAALVMMMRFHGVAADPEQIRHATAAATFDARTIVRSAKSRDLKAAIVKSNWMRLGGTPFPAIAILRDGAFLIIGGVNENKGSVLVQKPVSPRPEMMAREDFEAVWDGRLILMTRRGPLSNLGRRFNIAWFWSAMARYRRLLLEVLVASFFLQIFALVLPLFFQVIIDKVLSHHSIDTLNVLIIGLVAVSIAETILTILRTYLFSHTTSRIDVELGSRLFQHLLALPIPYFEARRVGDSVARVRELENIRNFLTSSALTLVMDLLFTVIFLLVMNIYSSLLTGIVLVSLVLYAVISLVATPAFRRRLDEKFALGAENQAFLVESITGIDTLKAMSLEPQMQRRWEEQLANYVTSSFRVLTLGNTASQAVQLVSKLTTAATLFIGAKLVMDESLTVGELVAFNIMAGRVGQPVLRLAQIWQDFHQARLSVARLGDILNTNRESGQGSRAALPPIAGDIRFEHVSFRYRIDASSALSDLSFSIPYGQIVGIVGSSGSGKSTIAKMIQRFYVPETGRILVDGVDLALADTSWLRRQIGVVLQESTLFNRSIRDNIALSDPSVPMERVIAASRLAGAHDFILGLPEGYDTVVGERGSSLSGGQRQRIAIARALINDPRILILDEATSALDYDSERIIQQNMRDIAKGRTVIIIAHRLSTVRLADRILTIEKGRLVEDGTHDELLGRGNRYASLHRLQAGLNTVDAS